MTRRRAGPRRNRGTRTSYEKTGRTEEELMHEDFGQIHDVNNPPEKEVGKHGKP
jgi:hypothetical protein